MKLKVTPTTAYNMLARIRNKDKKAMTLHNRILGFKRRSKLLDMVLSPRYTISVEEETKEEI